MLVDINKEIPLSIFPPFLLLLWECTWIN